MHLMLRQTAAPRWHLPNVVPDTTYLFFFQLLEAKIQSGKLTLDSKPRQRNTVK
jgi:hypothetical protein